VKKYRITYQMHPAKNIVVVVMAKSEEEAIIFAKQYRKDVFTIAPEK
jgi:mRNA-degrading endonuclease RelE of RelBE toxin-antitoxin system